MNIFLRETIREYQFFFMKAQSLLNYGVPETILGPGSVVQLAARIKADGLSCVLLVAGKTVSRNGLIDSFVSALAKENIDYILFDGAQPDPTIANVEDCVSTYKQGKCQGIVAFGGGSSMDCAKIAAARITNPERSVEKLKGIMKVKRPIPRFYAVPTTAGTGSETTIAAVIKNPETHHKYAVTDPKLLPHVAVLDPELTTGLPPAITAMTGMDALTHAVEAYTNKFGSVFAYTNATKAVKLILDNIEEAYEQGDNLEARESMLKGSFYAGVAFTRNCVGYVHALGHALGGMYGVPHGQAMAVILPKVLRRYGASAQKRLAELADLVGIDGNTAEEKASAFINRIEELNEKMGIPSSFPQIKEEDINKMAGFAAKEANPMYPVPQLWTRQEFADFYRKLRG